MPTGERLTAAAAVHRTNRPPVTGKACLNLTGSPASTRTESVRNAWTRMLRNEVIRTRSKAVAKIAHVGVWLATYGDADGSNCYPGSGTLATVAGSSEDTVGRALRVLRTVGLISGKRRPNGNTIYQLHMPIGGKVDWEPHLHLYTETRQKRALAKRKQAEVDEYLDSRNPSGDGFRNPSAVGAPAPVRSGGTNSPVTGPDPPRNPSALGGDQYLPTYGRYPLLRPGDG